MDAEYNQERYKVQDDTYTYNYRIYSNNQVTPQYIHVYSAGAGGILSDMSFMYNSTEKNDTLYFVLPSYTATEKAVSAGNVYAKYIDELAKKYNIPASHISVAGYSQGANAAASTYASLIEQGYNIPFYVSHAGNSSDITRGSYDRVAEVYRNNGTKAPAFIYLSEGNADLDNPDYPTRKNNLKWALEKWPGDVIELYNPNNMHKEQRPYSELDLVDFLNGTKELENYDIFKYVKVSSLDANGNRVERTFATHEEFEAYVKEYRKTFGTDINTTSYAPINFSSQEIGSELVQSDRQELLTYLNDIRKNLTLEVSVNSYNSTTAIPNSESEAIQQFFEGTQRLFQVIDADTEFILSAAISLEDLDKLLSEKAGGLGGSSGLGNVITGITTAIGGALGYLIMGLPGSASGALIGNQVGSMIGQFLGLDTSSSESEAKTTETDENTNPADKE